jgi:hypothetical protein
VRPSKPWAPPFYSTVPSATNAKAERFNRTLLEEWAYVRPYQSNQQRSALLPEWLHVDSHHRAHTALAGRPPISRVNDLPGSYI